MPPPVVGDRWCRISDRTSPVPRGPSSGRARSRALANPHRCEVRGEPNSAYLLVGPSTEPRPGVPPATVPDRRSRAVRWGRSGAMSAADLAQVDRARCRRCAALPRTFAPVDLSGGSVPR
jgi:hypothetical protein